MKSGWEEGPQLKAPCCMALNFLQEDRIWIVGRSPTRLWSFASMQNVLIFFTSACFHKLPRTHVCAWMQMFPCNISNLLISPFVCFKAWEDKACQLLCISGFGTPPLLPRVKILKMFSLKYWTTRVNLLWLLPPRAKLIMTIATLYNKHGERNLARQVSQWRLQHSLNHLGEGIVSFLFFLYVCIRLKHDAH